MISKHTNPDGAILDSRSAQVFSTSAFYKVYEMVLLFLISIFKNNILTFQCSDYEMDYTNNCLSLAEKYNDVTPAMVSFSPKLLKIVEKQTLLGLDGLLKGTVLNLRPFVFIITCIEKLYF